MFLIGPLKSLAVDDILLLKYTTLTLNFLAQACKAGN